MRRYKARSNFILDIIRWDGSQRILDLFYLLTGEVDVSVKNDQLIFLDKGNIKVNKGNYIAIILKPEAEIQVLNMPKSKLEEVYKEKIDTDHECKGCFFFTFQYRITPDTYYAEMVISKHPVCIWGEIIRDLPPSRKPSWCPLE